MAIESPKKHQVQVLDRAALILKILSNHKDGLSIGKIANLAGLSRSTVHRLLSSMKKHNWVSVDKGYVLGAGLFDLFYNYDTRIIEIIRPQIDIIANKTGETITLGKLVGNEITFIDRRISEQELRFVPDQTTGFAANCLSNGKALLALKTDEEIIQLFSNGLPSLTVNSIVDMPLFLKEIQQIRTTQLAFDHEEYTLGITSVAIAITQPNGVAYAITISAPSQRFKQRKEFLAKLLLLAKKHITALL